MTKFLNVDFNRFVPREERHYCAHLFAWLLYEPNAVKQYLNWHSGNLFELISKEDCNKVRIFYEFTALREYLYSIRKQKDYDLEKNKLNSQVFKNKDGDIQKKKPDLAFYFPESKVLILTEAKFEEGFKKDQIQETEEYGSALKSIYTDDIEQVIVSILGLQYHVTKMEQSNSQPCISWETVYNKTTSEVLKDELKRGLDYQKIIHSKAMSYWNK
jgi:hypothetical protein